MKNAIESTHYTHAAYNMNETAERIRVLFNQLEIQVEISKVLKPLIMERQKKVSRCVQKFTPSTIHRGKRLGEDVARDFFSTCAAAVVYVPTQKPQLF
jgi:hypothetical protein